jgi:hypothetical protein
VTDGSVHVEPTGTTTRQFLLEVWLEPREVATAWLLRGRIKDLASGEDSAVGSLAAVGRFVDRAFDAAGAPARQWQAVP